MLKCLNCEAVFNDEDRITVPNYVPYGDRYVSEDWAGCPYCHSTDIEDYEEDE